MQILSQDNPSIVSEAEAEEGASSGPLYLRLAREIADRILGGDLPPGSRLPPQRDLAYERGITTGTVLRAYGELQRQGLVEATVGRGSFVRRPPADTNGPDVIDLRANRPPLRGLAPDLLRSIARQTGRFDECLLADRIILSPRQSHANLAGGWLANWHGVADSLDPVLCSSGQHALFCSLSTLCRPGDAVVTESSTYIGLIMLARMLGLTLVPAGIDEGGLIPGELEAILRRHRPKVLVCTPNLHSPTTVTMPLERRREIAAVAKRHRLHVIEDDVYGACCPDRLPPLRSLLPETTILFTSFSKVVAPGVAVGLISAPPDLREPIGEAVRVSGGMVDPLSWEAVTSWMEDGSLGRIVEANRREIQDRNALARDILRAAAVGQPACPHLWLPLPRTLSLPDCVNRARAAGILVIGSDQFAVTRSDGEHAIRISLSAAPNRMTLERALITLRDLARVA